MDYYNCNDIMNIIGCGKSQGYKILSQLIESFKKEYPESFTVTAKIPKWYFEKKFKNKE